MKSTTKKSSPLILKYIGEGPGQYIRIFMERYRTG